MYREQNHGNSSQDWLRRIGLMGLCTGLAAFTLLAGKPASALLATEPEEEEELAGNFDEPMAEGHGEGHGKSSGNFSSSSTTIDDDGTWTVTNKNGKVTVEHDGKKIDKDRIRERRGQIEVLDESGKVIKRLPTANISIRGNGLSRMFLTPPAPAAVPQAPRAPRPAAAPRGFAVAPANAPKVMLGVTMADADPDLLEQLGIDSGVLLMTVRKDLPAAKAGLQAKDVIFEADGKNDLDEESLRDILKDKNAGDELKVKVKRKGEDKEFTIKLEKYDAGVLGNVFAPQAFEDDGEEFNPEQLRAMLAEIEAQVKAQADLLRNQINSTDWNKVRDEVSQQLDDAMRHMADAREKAAAAGKNWLQSFNEGQWNTPSPQVFRIRPGEPSVIERGETDKKLDRLAEQLERLNNRLDEMEKKIDKR